MVHGVTKSQTRLSDFTSVLSSLRPPLWTAAAHMTSLYVCLIGKFRTFQIKLFVFYPTLSMLSPLSFLHVGKWWLHSSSSSCYKYWIYP